LADTTPQSISNWELGLRTPTLDRLARLVKVYGVTLDELIAEEVA
jgi:transcriptional regulator with XRE-family HTH domain